MAERQVTFIDVDENSLVVRLKKDRIQLRVVDSRPELEAGELRAFASVLFAQYVGGPLVARLEAVRGELDRVRDRLARAGSAEEALDTLDRSARAIGEIAAAIAGGRPAVGANQAYPTPGSARGRRSRVRGSRAGAGELMRWGWVRCADDEPSLAA